MIYFRSVDSLYEYIRKIGLFDSKKPLILIGGCARSGKSTVAKELSKKIISSGFESRIVGIDSWLISIEKRKPVSTVLDRYDRKEIVGSIKEILDGNIVYPPVYDVNSRRRIAERGEDYILAKSGVIITEGVIALALEEFLEIAFLKIFVSVPEKTRLKRLKSFYQETKGLSYLETKNIISSREKEEVPFIKKTARYADIILKQGG